MSKKLFGKIFIFLLVVGLLFAVAPTKQALAATLDVCPTCTYTTIQAAITAASAGDTINVAAGTYVEQLLIQKDLILVGAGIGQTIVQAPTSGRVTAPGYTSQVWTADNWNTDYLLAAYPTGGTPISVKVTGFTFDANGQSHVGDRFTGVYFRKVSNTDIAQAGLFASEIKGFNASDPSVTGIRVMENSKLTLSGNQVKDYTILGIVVYGTDNLVDPIVTTNNNTLTPSGSVEGIQYRFINGSGTAGIISNNTITNGGTHGIAVSTSDHVLVKDNTSSAGTGNGITLESASNCIVQGNTIANYPWNGIAVTNPWANSVGNLIQGNTITGIHSGNTSSLGACGWGIGMDNSSSTVYFVTNTVVTGNDVSTSDAGIVFFGVDATNVAHNNIIHDNSPYNLGNSNAAVTINAENNWWGSATGPAAGKISGLVDYTPWYATATTTPTTQNVSVVRGTEIIAYSDTIQAAIDAAQSGDTIQVAAGTYTEYPITIDKSLTLQGAGSSTTIIDGGETSTGGLIQITASGTVTISGFTIQNTNSIDDHGHGFYVNNANVNVNILDNAIKNVGPVGILVNTADSVQIERNIVSTLYSSTGVVPNGIQVGHLVENISPSLGITGTIKNNTISGCSWVDYDVATDNYESNTTSAGILIMDATAALEISNNNIHDNNVGIDIEAGPSTKIENNDIHNNAYGVVLYNDKPSINKNKIETNSQSGVYRTAAGSLLGTVDASPNWWGSAVGPAAGQISGNVDYSPWCTNEACTTFAPDAGGNVSLSGTINVPGGIFIGTPGLKYHLAADTVIQNNSPCFVITASNTIIDAEPGAKCIPTGGSNGIDVAAGLNNITVSDLEIDGTGQTTGDGIHFAGAVFDIVLVDNKIHDLDGDGIEFAGDVSEVVNIQGNMFKANGGFGINNLGANTVGAEYNSWGNVAGPAAGDGVNGLVTSTPFTHADLYVVSSGTPWANQVVKGQQITYTVKAHLVNVNAADFYLEYPTNLTYVSLTVANALGNNDAVTHDPSTRKLHFIGYSTTGNKTGDLALFSVTFTADSTVVDAPLSFSYGDTSGFGMVGYESSSNVFVNEMVNGSVTVIDLPTLTSSDIQGYYLTDKPRDFHVSVSNPSTGGNFVNSIYYVFTIEDAVLTDLNSLTCKFDGSTDTDIKALMTAQGSGLVGRVGYGTAGFPMAPGFATTTTCTVNFNTAKNYVFTVDMVDGASTPVDFELATLAATAVVYDPPTLTSPDIQGYYLTGEARDFHVSVSNPSTGGNFVNSIYYVFTIQNAALADLNSLTCKFDGSTDTDIKALMTEQGSGLVGRVGYGSAGFPMAPGFATTTTCTVNFAAAGSYSFNVSMVDDLPTVDVELVTLTNTSVVYAKPVITPTNLGGPFDAGVPETVSLSIANTSIPEPFEVVFAYPEGTVISYGGTNYTCTATACLPISVVLDAEPTVLNFTVTFDEAWTGDVSVSLFDSDWTPADRLLASASATNVKVNGNFVVTGTFSMQGNTSREGIPVTLTWGSTFATYGPTGYSTSAISNNFSQTVTYGGTYTITTNQPRYLNVYADVSFSKIITVLADYSLPALQLRAGNAVWTGHATSNNKIDLADANQIGTDWGKTTNPDGNVNFDNIVNIQDLALVGGNYSLTSAAAYASWLP